MTKKTYSVVVQKYILHDTGRIEIQAENEEKLLEIIEEMRNNDELDFELCNDYAEYGFNVWADEDGGKTICDEDGIFERT